MPRAFLSHSSVDKDYVDKVARQLKRSNVVFDSYCFEEGVDFRQSIIEGLDNAEVFVLFASRASLNSTWVKFELDEAQKRFIEGSIKKILVFTIGKNIDHKDLPYWLRNSLVIPAPGHTQAARFIHEKLIWGNKQILSIFVGREEELKEFSRDITNLGMDLPQVIAISGLEGVGRRTFAKYALNQYLNLRTGPIFQLNQSEGIDNLYMALLEENMELVTKEDIAKSIGLFKRLSEEQKALEVARQLSLFAEYNIVPIIVDNQSLLTDEGEYSKEFVSVFENLRNYPETTLVIIHTRTPQIAYGVQSKLVFSFKLKPLSQQDTARLLQMYLMNFKVKANNEQIREVSTYLDGYPPAVIFAAHYAKAYGMDLLIADKRLLTDFKAGAFTEYLKKVINKEEQKDLVVLFGALPPLSLSVLSTISEQDIESISEMLRYLIDFGIVNSVEGKYVLADPVREASRRLWGVPDKKIFRKIAFALKKEFWDSDQLPDLATIDVLIFSLLRAELDDELANFKGVIMPSTLLKAARAAYDNREWIRAKYLAKQVIQLDESKDDALVIQYKSLVREEREYGKNIEDEIRPVISELRRRNHKSVHYLAGFRAWKRKRYEEAIRHYKSAIDAGDESNSVYRELAECQYRLGDLSGARHSISKVLGRGKPNPYVLDLAAKIAIELENFEEAEKYMTIQELVDRPENFAHRKAAYFVKKKEWIKGLEQAEIACKRTPPLPETFFLKARILIELEKYDEAEQELNYIQQTFKNYEFDLQKGLACKLYLRRFNWQKAESEYLQIRDKDNAEARALRVQILRQKIDDPKINELQRQKAKEEIIILQEHKINDLFNANFAFEPKDLDD